MKTESFRGRDFLTLLDYSHEEVETILDVALDLKRRFAIGEPHDHLLRGKTLFMIFYNTSLRTRNSFEAGMTQLGGHAHYLEPGKIYTPALPGYERAYETERVSDVARVLSRMGHAISIRCYGDPVEWIYGKAHEMEREFARWADIPVLNMECDKFHPFQALADILTVKEKFGGFSGVKFVMSWAYSPSVHKPRAVPQSAIIAATMMGMDVVLAHPEGMELDDEVIAACEEYAEKYGGSFSISNDMGEAFEGADVVYPESWTAVPMFAPPVGGRDEERTKAIFEANRDWICDAEKMKLAHKDAIYMHCLPCDRGFEVTDQVIDGPQSVVFDEAENRLHVQKAVMSLVMR
ncbi:MAG TPA: N-acetylornithine carbamoyltransferase [Anaerolineae bacterium]|nr:N-acetylornithine carbamoyltransferase [Anaerolineae bacterium]